MAATTLTDRAVIRVSGEDVRGFLQGLITGGTRLGITIARANCRAVWATTAFSISPSRKWTCQSSGRRMVMRSTTDPALRYSSPTCKGGQALLLLNRPYAEEEALIGARQCLACHLLSLSVRRLVIGVSGDSNRNRGPAEPCSAQ